MSGWFPQYSPNGQHLVSGNGPWTLDGQEMPGYAWGPVWFSNDLILLPADPVGLDGYALSTGQRHPLQPDAVINGDDKGSGVRVGGGRYGWWRADQNAVCLDNGTVIPDACQPALYGSHLAYLLDRQAPAQRVMVDGRLVATMPATNVRCCAFGVVWTSGTQLYGTRWDSGIVVDLTPSWEGCWYGVPLDGPGGEAYLLAYDQHRLVLVRWGTSRGWVVKQAENTLGPSGVYDGTVFRLAWSTAQGVTETLEVVPGIGVTDVYHDEFEPPPPPPPEIREVTFAPTIGVAPLTVTGAADWTGINLRWQAWRQGDTEFRNDQSAVNDSPHVYQPHFEVGRHQLRILVQGADGHIITSAPEAILVTTAPNPPAPDFPEGWAFVHCGFGQLIDSWKYEELKRRGWEGARVEAAYDSDEGLTEAIVREVLDCGLRPVTICRTLTDLEAVPAWTDVEWHNEPNGSLPAPNRHFTPTEYVHTLPAVIEVCTRRHLRLWVGSINNLSRDGLAWLRAIIPAVPAHIGVSIHRYPEKNLEFSAAHAGFSSRRDEIAKLKAITGPRPLLHTEGSYTQAPRRTCFGTKPGLTNVEVKARMVQEEALFRAEGFNGWTWFQIWEGPKPDMGLADINWRWKDPQSRRA